MPDLLLEGPRATVGRDPASSVFIADPHVSRRHAALSLDPDGWRLTVERDVTAPDLVRHNGIIVAPGTSVALALDDTVAMGRSVELRVGFDGARLRLTLRDETTRALDGAAAPLRVWFPDSGAVPAGLGRRFDVRKGSTPPDDVDAALLPQRGRWEQVAARLRTRSFFLPLAILGPRPDGFVPQGDLYLFAPADDPRLSERLRQLVDRAREAMQRAAGFDTTEVLYLDARSGFVHGHDWSRGCPRELRLSELQHRILLLMGRRHRRGTAGIDVATLARALEEKGWARGGKTVSNELSHRLPAALRRLHVHPLLFKTRGTREKTYLLSTPPSCIVLQ